MTPNKILYTFLIIGLSVQFSYSQSFELKKIRTEIRKLEQVLKAKEVKEKTFLEKLEDIEREMGLNQKLITQLKVEINKTNREIRRTQKELDETMKYLQRLKALVAKRMVSMYKHGKVSDWKALFALSDFNKALVWVKYQQRIIKNDRKNLEQLKQTAEEIQHKKEKLNVKLANRQALIAENEEKSIKLKSSKKSQQYLLSQIRKSLESEREQLRLKKIAIYEIQDRIVKEAEKKKTIKKPPQLKTGKIKFSTLKGKMEWPVNGRIVSRYGNVKNEKLKTWTENLGVGIKTTPNAKVQSVCSGQVNTVFWMRGMGYIVILDHGDDYLTVYCQLEMVHVEQGNWVEKGETIGQVGSQESLYQSTLEFQVWKGKDHQNPKFWLKG